MTTKSLSQQKETTILQSLKQKIDQKNSTLTATKAWLQKHSADKILLEKFPDTTELVGARNELAVLSKKYSVDSKKIKKITDALAKKKSDLTSITNKNSHLKKQIAEEGGTLETLCKDNSIKQLQELHVEQQERAANFQELLDLASVNSKLSNKGFFAQLFSFKKTDKEEKQLKHEHNLAQLELGKEINIIKTLKLAVSNEALLKKMTADRKHLIDGKACPLCGALNHPYSTHPPAVSNTKKVLIEQQKKVKKLKADEVSLKKQITSAQTKTKNESQKENKLQSVRAQWNTLANRLNTLSMELTIDNLSLMKDLFKAEKKESSNISNLVKQVTKLHASVTQAHQSVITNTGTLERTEKELEELTAEWNNRPKESIDLEQAYMRSVEQEKVLSEKLKVQLKQIGEKMPIKAKEDAFLKRLKNRKKEYLTQLSHSKSLSEEIALLDGKIATLLSE